MCIVRSCNLLSSTIKLSESCNCGGANMNIGPKKCKFPRTYKSQQLEANTTVESKTMPPVCCNVKAHLCFFGIWCEWFLDYKVQIRLLTSTYQSILRHMVPWPSTIWYGPVYSSFTFGLIHWVMFWSGLQITISDLSSVQWENQIIQRLISSLFKTSIHTLHT